MSPNKLTAFDEFIGVVEDIIITDEFQVGQPKLNCYCIVGN